MLQELRFALRQLRRHPGVTALALITLTLGIGAAVGVFNVVNSVLLRPLPFDEPDRLVRLYGNNPAQNIERSGLSVGDFLDFREETASLESVALHNYYGLSLSGDRPQEITTLLVTPGLLDVLGVPPLLGRTFLPEEEIEGNHRVVVLSHDLWQERFGGDEAVVGSTQLFDGREYVVVGVMPPGFVYPSDEVAIWAPRFIDPENAPRSGRRISTLARLAEGVTLEQAQAELSTMAATLAAEYPESNEGWSVEAVPLHELVVGDTRPALLLLLAAVAVMLLIACTNVGNLMLARGLERQREVALRAALGAGRRRLVRLLLTESLLLATLGGAAGLFLAYASGKLLIAFGPQSLPRLDEIAMDGTVVAFAVVLTLVTGLLFGILPALQISRTDLNLTLKEGGGRGTSDRHGLRLRGALTVFEVALSVLLLVGAGLTLRGFMSLVAVDLGFSPDRVVATQVFVYGERYRDPMQQQIFLDTVLEELRSTPGVEAASAVNALPLSPIASGNSSRISIQGRPEPEPEQPRMRTVEPAYFDTLGITLLAGRGFSERDREGAPAVAVLNRTAQRRFFRDQDPLQATFTVEGSETPVTIVGVVSDLRHEGLAEEPAPEVFMPFAQNRTGTLSIVVRAAGDPARMAPQLENAIWSADPDQPIYATRVMPEMLRDSVAQPRFYAQLIGAFALIALVVAAVGLYGVISYSVSRRTQEIGVRMALGAHANDVYRLILREGVVLLGVGVAVGLAAAVPLGRLAENLLYGISPTDPPTFAVILAVLTVVALAATFLPARRAAALDPLVALREE